MTRNFWTFLAAVISLMAITATGALAQGYAVRKGDVLRIEVLEDTSLNRTVLVAPDGRISMPLAGGIRAAGRSLESIQANISTKLASNFASAPTVYVALEKQKEVVPTGPSAPVTIDVFIVGEASKPGKAEVEKGATVLQLFAQMGGFSKFAAVKRIQLRRGGQTWVLNYKAIEAGTSNLGAMKLADGDVLIVPQRKLFE